MDQAWELATGEVFDGPTSLEKNLINKQGYLDDVIDDMIADEGLPVKTQVVRYVSPPSLRELITASVKSPDHPLDIQKHLEKLANYTRIQVIWLGR